MKFIRKKASKVAFPLSILIGDPSSLPRDSQPPALPLARNSVQLASLRGSLIGSSPDQGWGPAAKPRPRAS
ncbi:hypothetical protein N7452_007938 [Penicillium brevicompactum]|uniref:Uncharacterized protein n=1 Tax=Penicillium brevicompactum TaxID=5074 RepID=A0A9W9QLV3_PENBR|nr:hypothetical protein N7452_007938 [Penicillium brevicompactum]